MTDLITTPTPDTQTTANLPAGDPVWTTGTGQPAGDVAGGTTPDQETFTRVDPKTLPPPLLETYNNMLKDYKDKTTGIASRVKDEVSKAVAEHREKAEWYDKVIGQEEFVKQWNSYVEKVNQENALKENDPQLQLAKKVELLEQQANQTATLEAINVFANAKDDSGKPMHPNFDKLNSISVGEFDIGGGKRAPMSMLNVAIKIAEGNSPEEKIANGYQAAEAVYNAIFEEGKKAGLGRLNQKITYSSEPPTISQPGAFAPHRAKNALEALEFARQGLAVPK